MHPGWLRCSSLIVGPLCLLLRPRAATPRIDTLIPGPVRSVIGPTRARDIRLSPQASLCQHIFQMLSLDCRPAAHPLLGVHRNLQKLHASTLRRVRETSCSPARGKSDAECEYRHYLQCQTPVEIAGTWVSKLKYSMNIPAVNAYRISVVPQFEFFGIWIHFLDWPFCAAY